MIPTYRAFSMDECARETVLEAMQQNNIRPFTDARNEFVIENCCIPPPVKKAGRKKKKKGGRKAKARAAEQAAEEEATTEETAPQWLQFDSMKEAIDAGWEVSWTFFTYRTKLSLR